MRRGPLTLEQAPDGSITVEEPAASTPTAVSVSNPLEQAIARVVSQLGPVGVAAAVVTGVVAYNLLKPRRRRRSRR